jgi:hypothetical protein
VRDLFIAFGSGLAVLVAVEAWKAVLRRKATA